MAIPQTACCNATVNPSSRDSEPVLHLDARALARRVLLFCVAAMTALVLLDLLVYMAPEPYHGGFIDLFNVAAEASVGTWFSSTLTLAVALTLWLIRYRLSLSASPSRRVLAGWSLLAVFFTYLAIDDAVAIHEHIGSLSESLLNGSGQGWLANWLDEYPSYRWQVTIGPLFAAVGLFMLVFLWRQLEQAGLRWWIVAALGCLALAVAMDYVEGLYGGYKVVIVATGWRYETVLHLARVIEELLEMLGMTLFLTAFVLQFGAIAGRVTLVFQRD